MIWTFIKIAIVVGVLILLVVFVLTVVATKSDHAPNHGLALVVEDPPPDELDVELVDELPLRAQAIEIPREGVVQQPPGHYDCFENWMARHPSLVCAECLPVLRVKAVLA